MLVQLFTMYSYYLVSLYVLFIVFFAMTQSATGNLQNKFCNILIHVIVNHMLLFYLFGSLCAIWGYFFLFHSCSALLWSLQRQKSCNGNSCRGLFYREMLGEISEYKWMSRQKTHHQLSTKLHSSKRKGLSGKTGNHLNPFIVTHSHSSRQVNCYA